METSQTILQWILFYGVRILVAWGIVLLGRYLARHGRTIVQRLVAQPHVVEMISPTIGRILCNLTYYGLLSVAVGLALIVLGVPANFVLALGSVVFILAAISLQQSLASLAATVIFVAFQPFRQGEFVETLGKSGTVQEIQLFNTILLTPDQRIVSLSNSEIQIGGVINHTRTGIVRNEVTFMVDYQANLERLRQIILEIIAKDARILADPAPSVAVGELTDYGMRLFVYAMSRPDVGVAVTGSLREEIKVRFDAEGIAFARPELVLAATEDSDKLLPGRT